MSAPPSTTNRCTPADRAVSVRGLPVAGSLSFAYLLSTVVGVLLLIASAGALLYGGNRGTNVCAVHARPVFRPPVREGVRVAAAVT